MFQFSSVAQSCPTLCDPMKCNTPGLPVHQQLQEFTQTHVHQVGDAIHPSHPLSSPSPPAPNPSQHQSLFQWVSMSHFTWGGQSIGVSASVLDLPMITQDWSPLGWTGWISLRSKGLSKVFSKNKITSWLWSTAIHIKFRNNLAYFNMSMICDSDFVSKCTLIDFRVFMEIKNLIYQFKFA